MDRPKDTDRVAEDERAVDTMSDSEEEAKFLFERNRRLRSSLDESEKDD